jgi:chlorite dismutase
MEPETPRRQFVRFAFYKADPSWRSLPAQDKARAREELQDIVQTASDKMTVLRSYSTVGTRGDCDLLLWQVSYEMDDIHKLAADVNGSCMGRYLSLPYSYLAMTKRSTYIDKHEHEGQESRTRVRPTDRRYFFVYPFVKTRPWYLLSFEKRQELMNVHIEVGHKYPSVKLNTTYSFGLDDQEFVVAFETDQAQDFLDLVMALRESELSLYTLRDTPVFTCIQMPLTECLTALG